LKLKLNSHNINKFKMPKKDQTGPPKGSAGPRKGQGQGKGRAPGQGTGKRTGGKRGKC